MWKCYNCGEEHEDQFDTCWKCGAKSDETKSGDKVSKKVQTEKSSNKEKADKHDFLQKQIEHRDISNTVPYEYKFVQIPQAISVKRTSGDYAAADYIQETVDQYTKDGWEFYRIDTIGVASEPGCIASLFGAKTYYQDYAIICFRKSLRVNT